MMADVRRAGDRMWIEGVRGWSCSNQCSSVHAAQETVMRFLGEDVSYGHLVGVSGLAFRMQVSRGKLCTSSPHSCCGYRCVERSTRSLPWDVRIFEDKPNGPEPDDPGQMREARRAVMASIDRGVPAQHGNEEDGIIVGYEQGGETWIRFHPLHDEVGRPRP